MTKTLLTINYVLDVDEDALPALVADIENRFIVGAHSALERHGVTYDDLCDVLDWYGVSALPRRDQIGDPRS